jgi:hypothetical protein
MKSMPLSLSGYRSIAIDNFLVELGSMEVGCMLLHASPSLPHIQPPDPDLRWDGPAPEEAHFRSVMNVADRLHSDSAR